jgi:ribonuclease-3
VLPKLEKILPASLQETASFKQALTHRSASGRHNERMEFLGDSVLGVIITEALYKQIPKASEGYLSRLRASLVNEDTLADIAMEISLGNYLHLGSGELKSGGFRRKSILSDALEAVIASVFLQQGMDAAKEFVLLLFAERLQKLPSEDELKDPKSRLQELLQARGYSVPRYKLISTKGYAHQQLFTAECFIDGLNVRTQGISTSRRKAEQKAALFAFEQVTKDIK